MALSFAGSYPAVVTSIFMFLYFSIVAIVLYILICSLHDGKNKQIQGIKNQLPFCSISLPWYLQRLGFNNVVKSAKVQNSLFNNVAH